MLGAVNLIKNTDTDKYEYTGYGTGIDARSHFHCHLVNGVKMFLTLMWAIARQRILQIEKYMS